MQKNSKETSRESLAKRTAVIRILTGLGMAVVFLLLVWGLREQVRVAIDKSLVPIFGFQGNEALWRKNYGKLFSRIR